MKIKNLLCLLLSFCMMISIIPINVSAVDKEIAPTGDYVYYIESYEQLKAHALVAQADCRYILKNDIFQDDNLNNMEIVVSTGSVFNLDLNGYKIERTTRGNDLALFEIRNGGRMTINDTSENKTGGCSFSEGYADYSKAVFYNNGGELEIYDGYYEIFSPYEQGSCSVIRTTSGYTNIYDGTFDSSSAFGGDTISVGHNAPMYDVPIVVIFGGIFYGNTQSIDVSPFGNYIDQNCLYPCVYVLGGDFYITKDSDNTSFCYCNNGWGRVIVAEGMVFYKCLNQRDQMFLEGVSKKYTKHVIDDFEGGYYEVTAPPMIISEGLDYYYRLKGLCDKAVVKSYGKSDYENNKEVFDEILGRLDTIMVSETDKTPPDICLKNVPADFVHINWYMVEESEYIGENTKWSFVENVQNVVSWTPESRPEEGESYVIRCVVTKSNLSVYEDIVRLVYAPLKETETVESVEIKDIDVPKAGKNPDFNATAEDSFYINGLFWTDITDPNNKFTLKETDTFEAGHEYQLDVWIRANEFYQFKLDSDGCIDISALVGGKEAEVILTGTSIAAELTLNYSIPAEPEKPTETTAPDEQTKPTEPTESTALTEPTKETETTSPVQSDKPAETTITTEPAESSTSAENKETDPTEPSTGSEDKPTDSTEPSTGGDIKPSDTTEPSTGGDTKPSDTTEPSTGDDIKPSDTTEPSTGDDTKPSEPVVDKGILGDVNGDGKVNIKDATQIQKYAAKLVELTDAEKLRADVNADTKINIKDATAIQKYVAKIETGLPIGEPIQ